VNGTNESIESKESESKSMENIEQESERKLFRKGDEVKLMGLQSKEHWNGRSAIVVGPFSKSKRRWPVEVMEEEDNTKKALIRTKNLVLERKGPRWNVQEKKLDVQVADDVERDNNEDEDKERENKEFLQNLLWNNRGSGSEDVSSLEQTMGSFESLMQEMQRVRHDAKSGTLTDEQRRKRAEDAVMKLMPFMGLDDEDTETDAEKETTEKTQIEK